VAANDVAQLTFDNWVEHMSTQFHMSVSLAYCIFILALSQCTYY